MNAIFFNDNVYIAVLDKEVVDLDAMQADPTFIGCDDCDITDKYLYGGRVKLDFSSQDYVYLNIDGLSIQVLEQDDSSFVLDDMLSFETCVAFLNQIEHLGVDNFLSNYKQSLEKLKKEVERQATQLSQEISANENAKKASLLTQMELLLHELVCVLFLFSINMNAGLENYVYVEASDKIINQFFHN